jgi:hypothetical protein
MPGTAEDREHETIDLRDAPAERLAELVLHLTDCEPAGARWAVAATYRSPSSADEALRLAAHAMVELRDTSPASVRVAPYLGRPRHRHEDRPAPSGPDASNDRFDARVRHVAHRPLRQRNRPEPPGSGRTVARGATYRS